MRKILKFLGIVFIVILVIGFLTEDYEQTDGDDYLSVTLGANETKLEHFLGWVASKFGLKSFGTDKIISIQSMVDDIVINDVVVVVDSRKCPTSLTPPFNQVVQPLESYVELLLQDDKTSDKKKQQEREQKKEELKKTYSYPKQLKTWDTFEVYLVSSNDKCTRDSISKVVVKTDKGDFTWKWGKRYNFIMGR